MFKFDDWKDVPVCAAGSSTSYILKVGCMLISLWKVTKPEIWKTSEVMVRVETYRGGMHSSCPASYDSAVQSSTAPLKHDSAVSTT